MADTNLGHLDEIVLHVRDLDKMRTFYVDILGFEEDFYHEGNMLGLRTGGPALVLKASEQGATGVWLGLSCTGIEGLIDEITGKGVTITKPLWEGHWGARVVKFEDPEGNTVFLKNQLKLPATTIESQGAYPRSPRGSCGPLGLS